MTKVQIKSGKLAPFGGFFPIIEQFDALSAQVIDATLGLRCTRYGYQYSEFLRSSSWNAFRFAAFPNLLNHKMPCVSVAFPKIVLSLGF